MRAVTLKVEPFEFLDFRLVECRKELNQHGTIKIVGLIDKSRSQEYMAKAAKETWISVTAVAEDGEQERFFCGVLTDLEIRQEGEVHMLSIQAATGSFLLDLEQHLRSFQDPSAFYLEVMRQSLDPDGGQMIMLDNGEVPIHRFLVQYHETDWEFIKRVSSYLGTVVIPEDRVPGKKLYVGYRAKSSRTEILEAVDYRTKLKCGEYIRRRQEGESSIGVSDMSGYLVRSREIYGLGRTIEFQGRKQIIRKIFSWLEGQELCHEYELSTRRGGVEPVILNPYLSGISLKAHVSAVERTQVKVKIEKDENQGNCKERWFDYATVYSTPDGTGWYCMPEIGDEIRIVFPDKEEDHAYAIGSVHEGTVEGRTDPNKKIWKNRQDKEIVLSPNYIILKNNRGLSVELLDEEGIRIDSDKNITISAVEDVEIKSSGSVDMSAGRSILLKQGAARIKMEKEIDIGGGKIYMN